MAAANDAIASLTPSERVILGWIAEYLAAGPTGSVRQTIYAGYRVLTGEGQLLEGLELEHEDEKQSARLLLNTCVFLDEDLPAFFAVVQSTLRSSAVRRMGLI